jgi:hypothetical protein
MLNYIEQEKKTLLDKTERFLLSYLGHIVERYVENKFFLEKLFVLE